MSVNRRTFLRLLLAESAVEDMGSAVKTHTIEYPGDLHTGSYLTGTGDNQQDLVWTDRRTLTATSETLDLYAGLFGGAAHTLKVSGGGIFHWEAPLDGGGLTVTNTTAQDLKIDAGAATITYDILVWGVSA